MAGLKDNFVIGSFTPAYADEAVHGDLPRRAQAAVASLRCCRSCPRNCGVDRTREERGVCQVGRYACVTSAFAHHGEEDCLRGRRGSGTIFFGRCNLGCVFCQNWDISQADCGAACSAEQIARLMLRLQAQGCHNINLVTPEHVVPQVIEALALAIDWGLDLPIVYNTGAYDSVESLRQLEGLIDIYMPDFKLWEPAHCARYLNAADYAEAARAAIAEMHRQVGNLRFTRNGLACRGVLVRHLVMPGMLGDSAAIFRWLAGLSRDTYLNIMGQYHPDNLVGQRYPEINRRPTSAELAEAHRLAREAGLWRFDQRTADCG